MPQQGPRIAWIIAAILGALTLTFSAGTGIASFFLLSSFDDMIAVVVSALCCLGFVLGAWLLIAAVRGAQDLRAPSLSSPWLWMVWLVGTVAVWVVGVSVPVDFQTNWFSPRPSLLPRRSNTPSRWRRKPFFPIRF